MSDTFSTISGKVSHEIDKIKGSRFICDAFRVTTPHDAEARLTEIRTREPSATHHCWAYRIDEDTFRWSDDGEPGGTAGAPILRQIDGRDLRQVLVVVTRYYGGTKLGTGGLIRAYGDAASEGLDQATNIEEIEQETLELRFGYNDTAAAMQTLHQYDADIVAHEYGADTRLTIHVRKRDSDALKSAFVENLAGRGEVWKAEG